jgi:hypothetical protein
VLGLKSHAAIAKGWPAAPTERIGSADRGEDRRDVQLPRGALNGILHRLQIHAERLAR